MSARRASLVLLVLALACVPSAAVAATQSFPTAVGAGLVGVAPDGVIYVTNNGANKVYRYNSDGVLLGSFGGFGTEAGKIGAPIGIDFRSDGEVFVADLDYDNFPAQEFSSGGTPVRTFGSCCHGQALDVGIVGSEVDLLDVGGWIDRYQSDGTYISSFSAYSGSESAQMAVSPADGDIWVLGRLSHDVRRYTPTGTLLGTWNVDLGDGVASAGLTVDDDGNVYVGGRTAVTKFGPTGEALGSYEVGRGIGDIATHGSDLYIVDGSQVIRVEMGVPLVALVPTPSTVALNQPVTLTATAGVPFGAVATYRWLVDGANVAETGTTPSFTTSFAAARAHQVRVVVTSNTGASASADGSVQVVVPSAAGGTPPTTPGGPSAPAPPPPPSGPVGVSIDDGAQFTNDPHVTLRLVWPLGAASALLANDGGFRSAATLPLAAHVPWTLNSSGPERLPKTVYLRFGGSPPNYTDDIILDETPPTVDAASVSNAQVAKASASAAKKHLILRLKAHDKTSGVRSFQVASSKAHPGKTVKYASRISLTARPRYVRVRDRAGNLSRWRTVR